MQWNVESDHLIVQVTSLPSFATPVCSPLLKPPSQAPGPGGDRKAEGVDQSPSAQPKRKEGRIPALPPRASALALVRPTDPPTYLPAYRTYRTYRTIYLSHRHMHNCTKTFSGGHVSMKTPRILERLALLTEPAKQEFRETDNRYIVGT